VLTGSYGWQEDPDLVAATLAETPDRAEAWALLIRTTAKHAEAAAREAGWEPTGKPRVTVFGWLTGGPTLAAHVPVRRAP
jgi:hypothetical protein